MLEQFKTSQHRERSRQEVLVVGTDDALNRWASGRYDTSFRLLIGNQIFCLANCAESSGSTSE
jgi:hypothetical protein